MLEFQNKAAFVDSNLKININPPNRFFSFNTDQSVTSLQRKCKVSHDLIPVSISRWRRGIDVGVVSCQESQTCLGLGSSRGGVLLCSWLFHGSGLCRTAEFPWQPLSPISSETTNWPQNQSNVLDVAASRLRLLELVHNLNN